MNFGMVFWELCMCKVGRSKLPDSGKTDFETEIMLCVQARI